MSKIIKIPVNKRYEDVDGRATIAFDFADLDLDLVVKVRRTIPANSFQPILRFFLATGDMVDLSQENMIDLKAISGYDLFKEIEPDIYRINGPFDLKGFLRTRDEYWEKMIMERIKGYLIYSGLRYFVTDKFTAIVDGMTTEVRTRRLEETFPTDLDEDAFVVLVSNAINGYLSSLVQQGVHTFVLHTMEIVSAMNQQSGEGTYSIKFRYATVPEGF